MDATVFRIIQMNVDTSRKFLWVNFSWIPLDCEKHEIRPLWKIPAIQYYKSLSLLTNSHDRNDVTLLYFPHSVLGGGCGTLQQVGRGCASYHDNWGTLLSAPEQRACAKEKKGELSWPDASYLKWKQHVWYAWVRRKWQLLIQRLYNVEPGVCVCGERGREWGEVRRKTMRVKLVGQTAPFHDKFFSATMKNFSKQFTFL